MAASSSSARVVLAAHPAAARRGVARAASSGSSSSSKPDIKQLAKMAQLAVTEDEVRICASGSGGAARRRGASLCNMWILPWWQAGQGHGAQDPQHSQLVRSMLPRRGAAARVEAAGPTPATRSAAPTCWRARRFDQLQSVDVAGVAPAIHASEQGTALRDDQPQTYPDRAQLLQQAPATEGQFFRVPKIATGADSSAKASGSTNGAGTHTRTCTAVGAGSCTRLWP